MNKHMHRSIAVALCAFAACSGNGTQANGAAKTPGGSGSAGSSAMPSFDDVTQWIDDYAAAHPGKDRDIVAKSPSAIAADPDAQRLLALCGAGQLPVIPKLAWEYGGNDHAWIHPEQSALVYCVYIPVVPSTSNWSYDSAAGQVTADVYVLYPEKNPCAAESGAGQVGKCIGDATNFEILVDAASLNDGGDVGLSLAEAATELRLVVPGGGKVYLHSD